MEGVHICTYIHTYVCMYICTYIHMCTCTYIHTYVYMDVKDRQQPRASFLLSPAFCLF